MQGEPITQLPTDLYIPPEALEVILEAFSGPLDLLLYLIRRQNLDILDIPIAEITRQYVEYIDLMKTLKFELAAEYLAMAAILAEIKSRMLLPRPPRDDEDEGDPRAELIRRLQEYERFRKAAADIEALPRQDRDFRVAAAFVENRSPVTVPPPVEVRELLLAMAEVMRRVDLFKHHEVEREPLSVRERMSRVVNALRANPQQELHQLFAPEEGRAGVVVTLLAILELLKDHLVDVVQNEPLGRIYIRSLMQNA